MEFAIEKTKFMDFINICPIDKKSIIKDILLSCDAMSNKIKLKSIAYDAIFEGTAEGKVQESGECAVDGGMLSGVVKSLANGEFKCLSTKDSQNIQIANGKSKFKLLVNNDNIENIKSVDSNIGVVEATFDINNYMLLDMINTTEFSVANDVSRKNINGIFFKVEIVESELKVTMVSTDGHRLSIIENKIPNSGLSKNYKGLISNNSIGILKKFIKESEKIKIAFLKDRILFSTDNSKIIIRSTEEEYPDYTKIIPDDGDSWIKMNVKTALDAIRRTTIFNNEKRKGLIFNATKSDTLSIESKNIDIGEAKEEISVTTSPTFTEFMVSFNFKYVLEVFDAIALTDENILWYQTSESGAAKIYPSESKNKQFIVMPIRL